MQTDNLRGNVQTQSDSSAAAVELDEGNKNQITLRFGNPDTGVLNFDAQFVVMLIGTQQNCALSCVLDCIRHQIADCPSQPLGVGLIPGQAGDAEDGLGRGLAVNGPLPHQLEALALRAVGE